MRLVPGEEVCPGLRLVSPLREGAMGSVWVAHRGPERAPVAVKFVSTKQAGNRAIIARFNREAAAAARIDSPHVVRIIDHGTTADGTPYLVMERLEGETLGQRLARLGRLVLDDAAAIIKQVGKALEAAHARGIVHRDIKPDNVFLVGEDDFPLVKVLDFGMAKSLDLPIAGEDSVITATGAAVGTPEYMSPEQVLGGKEVDAQSDLWALGVLAYRALAGVAPFQGDTPHALFFGICSGEYTPLAEVDVPVELEGWFRRALSPKKTQRFQSAGEMIVELERAIAAAMTRPIAEDEDEDATQLMDISRMRRSTGPPPLPSQPPAKPAGGAPCGAVRRPGADADGVQPLPRLPGEMPPASWQRLSPKPLASPSAPLLDELPPLSWRPLSAEPPPSASRPLPDELPPLSWRPLSAEPPPSTSRPLPDELPPLSWRPLSTDGLAPARRPSSVEPPPSASPPPLGRPSASTRPASDDPPDLAALVAGTAAAANDESQGLGAAIAEVRRLVRSEPPGTGHAKPEAGPFDDLAVPAVEPPATEPAELAVPADEPSVPADEPADLPGQPATTRSEPAGRRAGHSEPDVATPPAMSKEATAPDRPPAPSSSSRPAPAGSTRRWLLAACLAVLIGAGSAALASRWRPPPGPVSSRSAAVAQPPVAPAATLSTNGIATGTEQGSAAAPSTSVADGSVADGGATPDDDAGTAAPAPDAGTDTASSGGPTLAGDEGELTIQCEPSCTSIRIDEHPVGPSPLIKHPLPAGQHVLALARDGGLTKVIRVDVVAGKHITRQVPMHAAAASPRRDDPYE